MLPTEPFSTAIVHDPIGLASFVQLDDLMDDRREREVANEVRSRARNERIETATANYGTARPLAYEGVRAEPTQFAIAVQPREPRDRPGDSAERALRRAGEGLGDREKDGP
jgi:hypothetical protein